MKKLLIITLFRLATPVLAQDSLDTEAPYVLPKTIAKINAGAFLTRTLQAEFEFLSDKKKSSFQFSPAGTIYHSGNNKVYGLGLTAAHRKYLREPISNKDRTQGAAYFYFSAGYHYYDTRYTVSDYDFHTGHTETDHKEAIHKFSADIGFGIQFIIKNMISVDLSAGGGLRYANSSRNNETHWNDWSGDYGYTGFAPRFSIAFGIVGNR